MKPKTFRIVDDDAQIRHALSRLLTKNGHDVASIEASSNLISELCWDKPDVILLDIMMPGYDGLELCRQLRAEPLLGNTKIIIHTSKAFTADRRQAEAYGADGFVAKNHSLQKVYDKIKAILDGDMEITYWGVHGTLPVSGPDTNKYGGQTSCVSLELANQDLLIFDGGSGIYGLGQHLAKVREHTNARLLISHPHWDHINGLPYFQPLYKPGNSIEICGPAPDAETLKRMVFGQMDYPHFPVTPQEFGSNVRFNPLAEGQWIYGDYKIETICLTHPGQCLGFKVTSKKHTYCYITDNEIFPATSEHFNERSLDLLQDFVRGADILTIDTTYRDDDYQSHMGWGHSRTKEVIELAHAASVKNVHLFHHDPSHHDKEIDQKLVEARQHLSRLESSANCEAPAEGSTWSLDRPHKRKISKLAA